METAQEALQKIPVAAVNLHIPVKEIPAFCNYAHNLVLTVLKDKELQRRLATEPAIILEELKNI